MTLLWLFTWYIWLYFFSYAFSMLLYYAPVSLQICSLPRPLNITCISFAKFFEFWKRIHDCLMRYTICQSYISCTCKESPGTIRYYISFPHYRIPFHLQLVILQKDRIAVTNILFNHRGFSARKEDRFRYFSFSRRVGDKPKICCHIGSERRLLFVPCPEAQDDDSFRDRDLPKEYPAGRTSYTSSGGTSILDQQAFAVRQEIRKSSPYSFCYFTSRVKAPLRIYSARSYRIHLSAFACAIFRFAQQLG